MNEYIRQIVTLLDKANLLNDSIIEKIANHPNQEGLLDGLKEASCRRLISSSPNASLLDAPLLDLLLLSKNPEQTFYDSDVYTYFFEHSEEAGYIDEEPADKLTNDLSNRSQPDLASVNEYMGIKNRFNQQKQDDTVDTLEIKKRGP